MSLIDIQLVDFLEDSSSIRFHYPLGGNVSEGTNNLIQMLIKRILTIRGSNELEPTVGSNFYGLFGTINYQEAESIKENFPLLLSSLVENIKQEQTEAEQENSRLEPSEKLKDLTMQSVVYDDLLSG